MKLEIEDCAREAESCLELLLPKPDDLCFTATDFDEVNNQSMPVKDESNKQQKILRESFRDEDDNLGHDSSSEDGEYDSDDNLAGHGLVSIVLLNIKK